jgi:heme-degrading monooxygenase HmoA
MPASVVLINVITVPQGKEEAFIQAWTEGAHLMTHEPGFIDTKLHRSLAPDARFQFINIAHWESVEAWQAAFAKHAPNAMLIRAGMDATPALYKVVVEYSHSPETS